MRILISAGEASGEMYGAQLIEALRRAAAGRDSHVGIAAADCPAGRSPAVAGTGIDPAELRSAGQPGAAVPTQISPSKPPLAGNAHVGMDAFVGPAGSKSRIEFFGVGGDRMRAAGCDTVVDAKELAVVGITEILSHLPKILGLYRRLIAEADKRKPDLAVVIDSPAFNWRVARQMKKRGVPTVYYVAPQFWAWRQGRVRLLRDYIDKALVIFPFEEKFYRDRGVDATFVGHPLAELPAPGVPREQFAIRWGLNPAKTWITLMPGSRPKEFLLNLPEMLNAVRILGTDFEFLLPIASTLDITWVNRQVFQSSHSPHNRIDPNIALTRDALPSLYHSRAGIVASGTATVEAAMMNTPFVMVYRVSPITYLLGKPRVKVPRFAMVNLIAGDEVVPELVQDDFTAAKVVARLKDILPDGPSRNHMLRGLADVKARLRAPNADSEPRHPADRAAEIILALPGLGLS